MNFEDEPYVRVYKRKTVTTKLIGWEGRAVLHAMMLEVDRAGVFDLSGEQPTDAIAALTEIPIDVCRVGLGRLIERGVVEHVGDHLVLPRFVMGQSAAQSDRVRQAESRALRSALARGIAPSTVTVRDETSQPVTECHVRSHGVTVGHSELSLAKQIRSEEEIPPTPQGASTTKQPKPKSERKTAQPPPEDFEPDEATIACASETGRDWRKDWLACRDWHIAKGEKKVDYQATLRGWMRRGLDAPRASSGIHQRPPQPNDQNNRYVPPRILSR